MVVILANTPFVPKFLSYICLNTDVYSYVLVFDIFVYRQIYDKNFGTGEVFDKMMVLCILGCMGREL